jgi:cell wall-associated NlpC family hydrolase
MTVDQKRWLVGRLETQALYGDRVQLLQQSGAWSYVAVTGQRTPRNTAGYPGWLPTAQLTAHPPTATATRAIVNRPTTWLYKSAQDAIAYRHGDVEVSFNTTLPVLATPTPSLLRVATPTGEARYVVRTAVVVRSTGSPPTSATRAHVVASARLFLGLQYLWAGTSAFGFDCSGLTSSAYRAVGVAIPRDASAQVTVGQPVATSALAPGDLLFYADVGGGGRVHHVSMYVGGGRMIQAPSTGHAVEEIATSTSYYSARFAGARRFLST